MQSQDGRAHSKLWSPLTLLESIQVHTKELASLGHSDRSVCFLPKIPDFEISGQAFPFLIQNDKVTKFPTSFTHYSFARSLQKALPISYKRYIKNWAIKTSLEFH